MPGRLMMEVQEPRGPIGLKRDGTHLSQASDGPIPKRIATPRNMSSPLVNGAPKSDTDTNGIPSQANDSSTIGSTSIETERPAEPWVQTIGESSSEGLSELEHFDDALVPFGTMLERLGQFAYFQLSETIESLADIHINHPSQLTNGMTSQMPPDKSQDSVNKKMRLLNFAQENKDRFIKALVLSDWARNMDEMKRLIDVSMFLRKQDWATVNTADSILRVKENMFGAKMPNPNIEGALEILKTSEASWLPDLTYLPVTPLSAEELLDTLTEMNFALTARLSLEEDLPRNFSNFVVANGRATFHVAEEFEVDLAIGDEDPEKPFYFIDLRLSFTPSSSLQSDRLRNQLEAQINTVLAGSGLKGCYDFLHNFILSHKLNVLRSQALEMTRGRWIDALEVQSVHRSLVVQYWTKEPGPKNWIELGISKTDGKGRNASDDNSPHVRVRWFRRNEEVLDHDLNLSFGSLSMEEVMGQVTRKHSIGRLSSLSRSLAELCGSSKHFNQDLVIDTAHAVDSYLILHLLKFEDKVRISIDSITGQYIVAPRNEATVRMQHALNHDLQTDGALIVRDLFCRMLLESVRQQAHAAGLVPIRSDRRQSLRIIFGQEPYALAGFQRRSWRIDGDPGVQILVCTIDLDRSLSWHLATGMWENDAFVIKDVKSILSDTSETRAASIQTMLHVERSAIRMITQSALARELVDSRISHEYLQVSLNASGGEPLDNGDGIQVCLKTSDIVPQARSDFVEVGDLLLQQWTGNDTNSGIQYLFRTKARDLQDSKVASLLRRSLKDENDLELGTHGELSMNVTVSVGDPVISKIQRRLVEVARLKCICQTVADNHFALIDASTRKVTFQYSSHLRCIYGTARQDGTPVLDFQSLEDSTTNATNPHARMIPQLQQLFATTMSTDTDLEHSMNSFKNLCQLLRATLPLFEVMADLEASESTRSISLGCHSSGTFRIAYKDPYPHVGVLITARKRNDKVFWVFRVSNSQVLSDKYKTSIAYVLREKGPGWEGLKNAAMAKPEGVPHLVRQLHKAIRNPEASIAEAQGKMHGMMGQQQRTGTIQQQAHGQSGQQQQQQQQRVQQQRPQQKVDTGKGGGKEVVVLD